MTKAIRSAVFAALACLILASTVDAQKLVREAISPYSKGKMTFLTKADSSRNWISTGLRVVGKGMMAYLTVDTTGVGAYAKTYAWSLASVPSGSSAALYDGATTIRAKFVPDVVGQYILNVTTRNKKNVDTTLADTIFASTYKGTGLDASCELCHATKNFDTWKLTPHALVFKEGVTGNLENDPTMGGKGAYGLSCIKCHTTGWENKANNGNFGYLANTTNWTSGTRTATWDSTWWWGLTYAGGDYWVPKDSMFIWDGLPAALKPLATIGCESCHGPATDHTTDYANAKKKIGKSYDAGVCNQCHAASATKYRIGIDWAASLHATPFVENQTGCFPCHSGSAFAKFATNPTTPGYDVTTEISQKTCATCHDPHGNSNTASLRTVKVINDTLMGGYKVTSGGLGQLCMNCHRGRNSVAQKVTNVAPYYGFSSRYYNHNGPQADMFWGQNGFDFGKTLTKITVHQAVLANSCVTCHMVPTKTNAMVANHAMTMDTAGVAACAGCHAGAAKIEDIKAASDYDGDGTVEGFQAEITGLLTKLKGYLPKDATGEVTGSATISKADSAAVYGKQNIAGAIWDYWFIMKDGSLGVHNPKYSVAMLQAAITSITGVERINDNTPNTFELTQNYPNPFNPSTQIGFALPKASNVRVNIYDITGKLVSSLVNESIAAGKYSVTWNGLNLNGQQVTSGVYIYRIEAGSFTATKKMLMLK